MRALACSTQASQSSSRSMSSRAGWPSHSTSASNQLTSRLSVKVPNSGTQMDTGFFCSSRMAFISGSTSGWGSSVMRNCFPSSEGRTMI